MIGLLAIAVGPAAYFLDGNNLYTRCRDQAQITICAGYISGVSDTISSMQNTNAINPPLVCTTSGVSVEQEVDIVVKYLRDNPAYRNQAAGGLVVGALMQAFPCTK
jgi:hypothetical protein